MSADGPPSTLGGSAGSSPAAPPNPPSARGADPEPPCSFSTQPVSSTLLRQARAALARHLAVVVTHPNGADVAILRPGVPIVVGRSSNANLRVIHDSISREHARFSRVGDRILVEDLESTNGTWHGGKRVDRVEVDLGEEVLLGILAARVQELGAEVATAAATPEPAESAAPPAPTPTPAEGASKEAPRDPEEPFKTGEPPVAGEKMRAVFATAARLADADISVLLHGETGVGKEVLARFLHDHGRRRGQRMATLNCAAIPAQLLESMLFGHERGAFTGAVQQHRGLFEDADGGTVFLDEIGELPLPAQAALLRVLETRRVCRIGSSREIPVDVRVVSATHRDLEAMSAVGKFRLDLYYRLNGITLTIPPLRERGDEIEPLALRFLRESNQRNRRAVQGIEPAAMQLLCRYPWLGNVRELRNAIDRAVVIAAGPQIRPDELPPKVQTGRATEDDGAGPPSERVDMRVRMERHEAQEILDMLAKTGGNRAEAARRLGMSRRTLFHKIKTMGLKDPKDQDR